MKRCPRCGRTFTHHSLTPLPPRRRTADGRCAGDAARLARRTAGRGAGLLRSRAAADLEEPPLAASRNPSSRLPLLGKMHGTPPPYLAAQIARQKRSPWGSMIMFGILAVMLGSITSMVRHDLRREAQREAAAPPDVAPAVVPMKDDFSLSTLMPGLKIDDTLTETPDAALRQKLSAVVQSADAVRTKARRTLDTAPAAVGLHRPCAGDGGGRSAGAQRGSGNRRQHAGLAAISIVSNQPGPYQSRGGSSEAWRTVTPVGPHRKIIGTQEAEPIRRFCGSHPPHTAGALKLFSITDLGERPMKRCPECGRTFTNNTLTSCLNDGATLVEDAPAPPPYFGAPAEMPPSSAEMPSAETAPAFSLPPDTKTYTNTPLADIAELQSPEVQAAIKEALQKAGMSGLLGEDGLLGAHPPHSTVSITTRTTTQSGTPFVDMGIAPPLYAAPNAAAVVRAGSALPLGALILLAILIFAAVIGFRAWRRRRERAYRRTSKPLFRKPMPPKSLPSAPSSRRHWPRLTPARHWQMKSAGWHRSAAQNKRRTSSSFRRHSAATGPVQTSTRPSGCDRNMEHNHLRRAGPHGRESKFRQRQSADGVFWTRCPAAGAWKRSYSITLKSRVRFQEAALLPHQAAPAQGLQNDIFKRHGGRGSHIV